jgi:hypothetical protein
MAGKTLPYSTSLYGHKQDLHFRVLLEGSQAIRSVSVANITIDLEAFHVGHA